MDTIAHEMRRLTEADIEWALDLAERCYKRKLGRGAWATWVLDRLRNPNWCFARGEHTVVVGVKQQRLPDQIVMEGLFPFWFSDTAGHAGELLRIFRQVLFWMEVNGVGTVTLRPTNGTDATPLATALGFTASTPSFRMEFSL
jgi:hypothetical protein